MNAYLNQLGPKMQNAPLAGGCHKTSLKALQTELLRLKHQAGTELEQLQAIQRFLNQL